MNLEQRHDVAELPGLFIIIFTDDLQFFEYFTTNLNNFTLLTTEFFNRP